MKLGELKSIGHNIADSLASGVGLLIGIYEMDIFAEAAAREPGFINIDFLTADVSGSPASPSLLQAVRLYRAVVPKLCNKHGVDVRFVKSLSARFGTDPAYGPHFTVTVESADGRKSVDRYVGTPGKRFRMRRGKSLTSCFLAAPQGILHSIGRFRDHAGI